MGFWIGMTVCNLLVPLIMLISGYCMEKHPPRTINGLIGYRTKRSMKNKDTWEFAHACCGRLWKKMGAAMLAAALLVMICLFGKGEDAVGIAATVLITLETLALVLSMIPVERALKNHFDFDED